MDTVKPKSLHGAAVVLADENLNTISLRMYKEHDKDKYDEVKLHEITGEDGRHSEFYARINKLIKPSINPWASFSRKVGNAVGERAANLKIRIKEMK